MNEYSPNIQVHWARGVSDKQSFVIIFATYMYLLSNGLPPCVPQCVSNGVWWILSTIGWIQFRYCEHQLYA